MPKIKPEKILEIGSYEGRTVCHIICNNDWSKNIELHCIDTWEGGVEHQRRKINMNEVEKRFDENVRIARGVTRNCVAVHKHKGTSANKLAGLVTAGHSNSFDFIYVDGSHLAPDVLLDATLGFNLLKVGGVMGFDDYTWREKPPYGENPIRSPKIAIDAFTTIFLTKITIINTQNRQLYIKKINY